MRPATQIAGLQPEHLPTAGAGPEGRILAGRFLNIALTAAFAALLGGGVGLFAIAFGWSHQLAGGLGISVALIGFILLATADPEPRDADRRERRP